MDLNAASKRTMMANLGLKKKDSTMDRHMDDLPKLSNEMQLSIMNKVKSGELSIEDALNQARRDQDQLLRERSKGEEKQKPAQYNFSVHKHGRYRWQKRVLQIDFNTKMLCSIEKGIIKRQLPFSVVKSCDDAVGSRFSISFKKHHDYELEATSLEDKHKMMQLVNQIIYGNIYSDNEEGDAEAHQQPQASLSLREGVLMLHRGGLASFRWVKYDVQLHPGQLTLFPLRCRGPADGEGASAGPVSTVIHLSDGDTRVEKPPSPDAFTLITHKNQYQFKVPLSDQTGAPGAVQRERDAWVSAIDKLCTDWKRKSKGEHTFAEMTVLQNISIPEDTEDREVTEDTKDRGDSEHTDTKDRGDSEHTDTNVESANQEDPTSVSRDRPHPEEAAAPVVETLSQVPSPSSPGDAPLRSPASPQPPQAPPTESQSPKKESGPADETRPTPPSIPPPPPLLFKVKHFSRKPLTKAFHWDVMGRDKLVKSFWTEGEDGRVEIDKSLLYDRFPADDRWKPVVLGQSNTQHIMLNQKVAHNFNIFLKSFPVQSEELKDKLFIIDEKDGGLSDEQITALRRFVPTVDDVEMYKSHKGPVTALHVVDQYMMEMCNIPYLSKQLDLLLTLRELPISMSDLQPLINQKIRMCMQLCHSRSFVSVLEYVLAIGNYLNENAGKEKAKGFRLSSLAKLSQLRGRDKTFTLLHALVEQIMLHEPGLATFIQDLAEFETVPGASIKGLTAEVDVLKNELQKLIQYRKTSKKRNAGAHHPNFSKDLKTAIEKHDSALAALTKTCEEMKRLYSVILVKFGEPADRDSQELFGLICEFVHDFKRAHAEIL